MFNPTDLEHLAHAANAINDAIHALEQIDSPEARSYAKQLRQLMFTDNGVEGLHSYLDILVKESGDLVTISEAATLTGRSISQLSNMVKRGDLAAVLDPTEPNPTKRTRLLRSQVISLQKKPKRK